KTINMPNEATVEDVEDAYYESWKHGIKAMALYRDGSKMSQPLSNKSDTVVDEEVIKQTVEDAVAAATAGKDAEIVQLQARIAQLEAEKAKLAAGAMAPVQGQQQLPGMPHIPTRRRLPGKRHGFTQEARIAGHKIYLRTGEYEDGTLGEVFIDMHKEGAAFRSMINQFAIAISKGLQYGVPLQEYVDTFTFVRFEPQGMVSGHPNIKLATSVIDFVFRVLALEYLGRTDIVQVPPAPIDGTGEDADLHAGVGDSPAQRIASENAPVIQASAPVAPASTTEILPVVSPLVSDPAPRVPLIPATEPAVSATAATHTHAPSAIDQQLGEMMGDAPFCDICGHVTVRNGACYKCLNCGNSLGCS
ncbi:MAG: hypothetical protein KC435_14205, partial [Thermomicrobiales bacterium]|nr:hypothetical protein [Thermomicrobiales bacterium]